jgi:ABC-type dipeptide/oligopeptide/nickel transport system permease component
LEWKQYGEVLANMLKSFADLPNMEYYQKDKFYPLFPEIIRPYTLSIKIFFIALFLAVLQAVIIGLAVMLLPRPLGKMIKGALILTESLPDLFVIALFQIAAIAFFQKTGILLFQIIQTAQQPAVLLPVLCLSVLPSVFLARLLVQAMEDEAIKLYVETAMGKGLRSAYIVIVHIFRNAIFSTTHHTKSLFWLMLSNLFIIEYFLNINGILRYLVKTYSLFAPQATVAGLIMIFVPFFLLFAVLTIWVERKKKRMELVA